MPAFLPPLPYLAMAAFLVVGLLVYERTGLRLGGVIVLPLLLVYAVADPGAIWMFGAVATGTFLIGQAVHRRTLLYGRRLFIVFLLAGLLASFAAMAVFGEPAAPLMLALLPGIFAFNLHREGNYAKGTAAFMLWLGAILAAVSLAVWAVGFVESLSAAAAITPETAWTPMQDQDARVLVDGGAATAAAATLHDAGGAAE